MQWCPVLVLQYHCLLWHLIWTIIINRLLQRYMLQRKTTKPRRTVAHQHHQVQTGNLSCRSGPALPLPPTWSGSVGAYPGHFYAQLLEIHSLWRRHPDRKLPVLGLTSFSCCEHPARAGFLLQNCFEDADLMVCLRGCVSSLALSALRCLN